MSLRIGVPSRTVPTDRSSWPVAAVQQLSWIPVHDPPSPSARTSASSAAAVRGSSRLSGTPSSLVLGLGNRASGAPGRVEPLGNARLPTLSVVQHGNLNKLERPSIESAAGMLPCTAAPRAPRGRVVCEAETLSLIHI
eukprot:5092369-Prymnesium_polylepis.1